MQYQGHTTLRRLLVMLTLVLVVLVAGGQPTFADGLDEKLNPQPDLQTQAMQAKDVSTVAPDCCYDWSDD